LSGNIKIRAAQPEDMDALVRLRTEAILATPHGPYSRDQLLSWAAVRRSSAVLERIADGCVLVAEAKGELLATNALNLDREETVALFVLPSAQGRGLGTRMVTEIEKLAIRFGLDKLLISAAIPAVGFYQRCGYESRPGATLVTDPRTNLDSLSMWRQFPKRQTRYGRRIADLLEQLGIPSDYGRYRRLPLQFECSELANIGEDIHDREQYLQPEAAMAWYEMRNAAEVEDVNLQVVSAYRSVEYQAGIIERKLQAGQEMDDILRVSAAPGYSEHHTGLALDLTAPGQPPLETAFENSPAFEWLSANAIQYGYRMSFPRHNRHKLAYEPWHWAWQG
jgi:D-alanyl-D-alanine carboxypeptidase